MYSEKVQVLLPSATGSSDWIEKLPCVRMMIWLAVYHQLYNQQVRNSVVMSHWHLPPLAVNVQGCRDRCGSSSNHQTKLGLVHKSVAKCHAFQFLYIAGCPTLATFHFKIGNNLRGLKLKLFSGSRCGEVG